MHPKRRLAALLGAALAPALAVTLPTGSASAHGWVTSPPSRQAQCAAGTVPCGDIKYEPQSVEGPKGLTSCSGGNAKFAELDDDSKGWRVTGVNRVTTFSWRFTARHSTASWQYFAGGRKLAEISGGGAQPPETVSHQVDFGSLTGRQKVLAVWNVADTGNAFYACIDVNVGGGTDPDPPTSCAAAWNSASVYTGGTNVTWKGRIWQAKWWTQGEEPGTTGEWGVWKDLGACTT
ncbi:lytic polysaccharide monooxygenase [Streptomyces boninensis]|uniref:lytic polysaccharide monooxygenase n=1 Tax=Streptomyces boninensis TaxID=2039455 RepID=UPI003B22516E